MQTQARPLTRDEVVKAARQQAHRLRHDAEQAAARWLLRAMRRALRVQGA